MLIKAPLICSSEVASLVRAGAKEFFCAVEDSKWRRRFENLPISQRRGKSNFQSLSDFKKAVKAAHRLGAKVHAAVNAFFYLPEQYDLALETIDALLDAGADGIIFSDPVLLSLCGNKTLKGKDAIVGCDGVVFNSASAAFYKSIGATRIVFPREMTIAEMDQVIRRDPSMEYEAFIMNDLCFFVDGFCAYCKGVGGHDEKSSQYQNFFAVKSTDVMVRGGDRSCAGEFSRRRVELKSGKVFSARRFSYWPEKHKKSCGACAVYDLNRIGVVSLKVLDRNLSLQKRIDSTRLIAKTEKNLKSVVDRRRFFSQCRARFKSLYGFPCTMYDCYYPDVAGGTYD